MQVPRLIAPGFTLGAALSNSTQERPCVSFPVTTRRIGFTSSAIAGPRARSIAKARRVCNRIVVLHPSSIMVAAPGARLGARRRWRKPSWVPLIGSVAGADLKGIHWAIVGGESGPQARPMLELWVDEIEAM